MMRIRNFALAAAGLALMPLGGQYLQASAHAQGTSISVPPGTLPKSIPTTATVVIGGAFSISPAAPALTQTAQQTGLCNPGACYTSTVTVKSNQRWQAQVRIHPSAPANTFVAFWITPAPTQQAVALSGSWYTIQSSTTSTTGTSVPLQFNANKATGKDAVKNAKIPTAAELSGWLEFRVIALP